MTVAENTVESLSLSMDNDNEQIMRGWMQKLPDILRATGVVAILFSLYSFLFRGWEGSNDFWRYIMLLAHSGLLTATALACGHYLREGKGPRILLMLALVSMPVNFAILGAFIYADIYSVSAGLYPGFVAWSLQNYGTAFYLSGAALPILAAITLLGFRALARGMSGRMTILFLFSNLALLLPIRDPVWAAGISSGLGLLTFFISTNTARQRTEAKTFEGMMAILLQFLPVGILLGRSCWLYAPDTLLFTAMSVVCFVALRHASEFFPRQSHWRFELEFSSLVAALVAGGSAIIACLSGGQSLAFGLILGGILSGLMCYELSRRAAHWAPFYQFCAVVAVCGSSALNLLLVGTLLTSVAGIVAGLSLLAMGVQAKQHSVFGAGASLLLLSVGHLFYQAFLFFDLNYWLTFATLGVVAIIAGSVVETRGAQLRGYLHQYRLELADWRF